MGLEFNGHVWEWFDERCRLCGIPRRMAWGNGKMCRYWGALHPGNHLHGDGKTWCGSCADEVVSEQLRVVTQVGAALKETVSPRWRDS